MVEKEEEKKREKRRHIFIPFLKISFLGEGIDTKIFVDRIFGGLFFSPFVFLAEEEEKRSLFFSNVLENNPK